MKHNTQESLSALMDGEAEDLELRRILKQMPEDKGIEETWERYHLLRSSLRQEVHSRPQIDLLSGIHAEIANDPLPERTRQQSRSFGGALKYLGQGAIAASVAAVVLFTADFVFNPAGDSSLDMAEASAGSGSPSTTGDYAPGELTRMASFSENGSALDEKARDRLRQAVLREFEEFVQVEAEEIPVNYTPAEQ